MKSAAHYTETALDEIKLLKCVSKNENIQYSERCVFFKGQLLSPIIPANEIMVIY